MRLPPILRLIAVTTLLRLAFAASTGLGVDESYMVTSGRVLSLGYFDHPPASWWLSWGAAHLFGTEAPWAVRLPFILLFALSQLLVWRITCLVADRRAGFWAVLALNLSPVFGVTTGTWVLPDGPLDAALLGAALCLLHALPADRPRGVGWRGVGWRGVAWRGMAWRGMAWRRWGWQGWGWRRWGWQGWGWRGWGWRGLGWWLGAGVCAGLALFSKYSAVLTIGGAFLYLLTSRPHRHWLTRPEPYIAAIVAAAVFSPVVIWNATHGWASFAFQGSRAAGLRFRPLLPLQTLAGEALFVLPWVWVPMMMLLVSGFRRGEVWPRRLLVWLAAPPVVGFALISAWSSQRVLYHWAAPGYLMLFPLLGDAAARRLDRVWVRGLFAGTAALVVASLAVIATQVDFDWLGGRLGAVMRGDPTAEGLDWTSIGDDLRARGLLPPGAVVAALNWRDAGKLGYALGPRTTMLCLNADSRQFGFAHRLSAYAGQNVLVLAVDPPGEASSWFRSIQGLPATSVRLDGRTLRTVTVMRGEGLRPPP
ncbi:glycosyltransferase family 39 protein [Rhodopila sp.]|uniref:glycosyltransferase family 39 protein n=1 Tax=Rhodopila sp. TaxID=2480087 RepID=UPI003D146DC2